MSASLLPSRGVLFAIAATSAAGALLLWGRILMDAWPTLWLGATVCGRGFGEAHCPLCLPAAVMTGLAVGAACGLVEMRRPARAGA